MISKQELKRKLLEKFPEVSPPKYNIGDIVIAEVNDEWTMKYLRKKNANYYLEAANDNYPDIYPEGELKIHAVVRSLVRKYESKK